MQMSNAIFRAWAYLKHLFRSWNTGGEGIHSPYLFYLVRMLIYDENRYYCWQDIERQRRELLRSQQTIEVTDYGTGQTAASHRQVAHIAEQCLEKPRVAQVLFQLVAYLGHVEKRPLEIVELGTSLGITTAYLAMPDSRNSVETYEGSQTLADIAQGVWQRLGIRNIRQVVGNIDDTLYNNNAQRTHAREGIDIAYIDANHTYEATLRYFDRLAKEKRQNSIYILDDIHYSPGMEAAWQEICAREDVTTTMDLYDVGLVFFDTHYLRRDYRLRI